MRSRVVVAGLGPGGEQHVTAETLTTIDRAANRFLRTARHPSAHLVPDATSFDEIYEAADRFDDVYAEIVERLVGAARDHDEVLYVVPGSPLVLEKSVRTLLDDDRVDVELLPAMSFLDVVWARLGLDPVEAGVRLVDGHEFATAAAGQTGPLLVAHTHANWVLSDIKLSVDDPDGDLDDTPVTLLQALGTADERIVETTWGRMDHTIDADHLTSLFVPELGVPVGHGYVRFHRLARTLRERCPWDIEQTHESLVPYLIEESYEVVDAIHAIDPSDPASDELLIEELGDLLYQIEFHATIAEQQGRFTIADVTSGIHDKLVRRHPHVFADEHGETVRVEGTGEVLANWEEIKRAEKGRTSVFDGVPTALPSLAYAHKVQKKAAKVGFDWPGVDGALPKIAEETAELVEAVDASDPMATADELGDLLFAVVNVSRHLGVDPESALRRASQKFRRRFEHVERLARERSIDVGSADLVTLDSLWDEAKSS
ncbi:nucleoside triphosphate pyrophosphohydrolase [Ilumatobacter sp.]|uniref:nucleoside triphosphate pyrophosphohydrolase n=1 Tax=Ilumatobacter sp. TaxID=1967498 RepID=UPI003AF9A4EF